MLQIVLMLASIFDHCAPLPTPTKSPQLDSVISANSCTNNFLPDSADFHAPSHTADELWDACAQAARSIMSGFPIVPLPAPTTLKSKFEINGPFAVPPGTTSQFGSGLINHPGAWYYLTPNP